MSTSKQRDAYHHLLKHFRSAKGALNTQGNSMPQAALWYWRGVLDSLYWQALGLGVLNLAKGIRRYLVLTGLQREVPTA